MPHCRPPALILNEMGEASQDVEQRPDLICILQGSLGLLSGGKNKQQQADQSRGHCKEGTVALSGVAVMQEREEI